MAVITIPEKLEGWSISILNELVKLSDIESETFDFKSEPADLHTHICAMTNTSGGFLVLGIEEIRNSDNKIILGFKKTGFKKGEEDQIRLKVANNIANIEPTPTVNLLNLIENDRFYPVLKIENEFSKKPFFIKGKEQCYVRIQSSTRLATRSTILKLFSSTVEQRANVKKIHVAAGLLKEAVMHTSQDIDSAHHNISIHGYVTSNKVAKVDLAFMRNSILMVEWFLKENDLLGRHTGQQQHTIGVNSIMHSIELLNSYVDAFNTATNEEQIRTALGQLFSWGLGSTNVQDIINFLDKVTKIADEFLSKYH